MNNECRYEHLPAIRQKADRELTWVDMVNCYPAEADCLGAFLVTSAAEVLEGVKPANLVSLPKRRLKCGRSLYALWQKYSTELLRQSQLDVCVLRDGGDVLLLLLYRRDLLEQRMRGRTMQTFLRRMQYAQPDNLEACLERLQEKFEKHATPNEVGMFLGYPLKDVNGFIDQRENCWQGRCLWKIYGPPRRSLALYHRFRQSRQSLQNRLLEGESPSRLLKVA